ncbi:MAG: hypothetical protein ABDH32_08040, partial [Candidatus Caldarchaeales archaeon]
MSKKNTIGVILILLTSIIYFSINLVSSVNADASGIEVLEYYWGQDGEEWAAMPGDRNVKLTLTIQNREDTTICGLKAVIYSIEA